MRPELHINLQAIQNNYHYIQSKCDAEIGASVKANCYGLGAARIVPSLYEVGCRKFFVATVEEAIEIRDVIPIDAAIYVLNGFFIEQISTLIEYSITPIINTLDQLKFWMQYHPDKSCAIHVDTGMNRLGLNVEDFVQLDSLPPHTQFIMSHLACDGDKASPYNKLQLEKFKQITSPYPHIKKSLAASAGVFLGPEYHFDIARVGAALYGLGAKTYPGLTNPIALMSSILQIRKCEKDEYVGYGSTKTVLAGTILATIPIGYADGFSRFFSNNSIVFINNKPAKIVGRISMDLTIIDVTHHSLKGHEKVELIGLNLYPDDLADKIGTIGYEILTSLSSKRFYVSYL